MLAVALAPAWLPLVEMTVGDMKIPSSSSLLWKAYKRRVVQSSAAVEDSMCVRLSFGGLVAFLLPWVSVLVLHRYDLSQFLFVLLLVPVFVYIYPLDDSSPHSRIVEDPSCIDYALSVHLFSVCNPTFVFIIVVMEIPRLARAYCDPL